MTDAGPQEPPDFARTVFPASDDSLRTMAVIVHGLNLAAAVNGITAVVAVIIAYLKRDEATGTLWRAHFDYAIRTFWIGLAVMVASILLAFVVIGIFGLLALGVWWLVRSIFGLLKAIDRRPIPNPESLLI